MSVDAISNPFAPGAGQRPPELAGRESEQSRFRILLDRLEAGRSERGIILTGLRGVGKTVLMEDMRSLAEQRGWIVAFAEAGTGHSFRLLASQTLTASLRATSLRHRTSSRLQRALGALKSFSLQASPDGSVSIGIEVDPLIGRADSGNLELDLSELIIDLGGAAADLSVGVLLIVDEMQELPTADIAAVASAAHQANRLQLPVAISGAGLPNLPAALTQAKSYAERLFAYHRIGSLSSDATAEALQRPAESLGVTWEPDALAHTATAADGYPYFLQVFGKKIWDFAPGPNTITADDAITGVAAAQHELDEGFYGSRWERATQAQRRYLAAMAADSEGDSPVATRRIAARLGESHHSLSPHRIQLIRKGLIYAPERGQVAFTVSGMGDYINKLAEQP